MKLNKLKPLTCSILLGMGLLAGVTLAQAAPTTDAGQQHVLRATLKNGLRVVIVHDALAPVVTTQINYLVGGYETPKGFPGTAHALEHMMFRDSAGMTGAQLNEMTGKMGGANNAFTTNDVTQYYFEAPSQYLDILLHIEATRMSGLLLNAQDWALERGAIEQEVSRDISDPGQLAYEKAQAALYAGTGYAADALGTRPSFDKTTPSILRKFHNEWYGPNNAIFVIAGDIDPQATLAKVKQLFGAIPARATPKRAPVVLQPLKPQTIVSTTPQGTGSVSFMFRMPGQQTKDYAAMQVLFDVLSNARSSLSELAVQGKVLSASALPESFTRGGIGVIEADFPKGGDVAKTKAQVEDVIARLLKNGIPADLVDAAKRSELNKAEFNKNSSTQLANAWSLALAWQGLDSPEQAEDLIRKVTVDDVNRVARTYLKPDERVTMVLTPSQDGKRPPDSAGFGGTESFAGNDNLDVPLPAWAAQPLSKLTMPHWTLAPVSMTLDNGLHLVVQPETISKTVTVMGYIDHDDGLQEPKGKEGVGKLLSSLFDYGTADLDRAAFHQALDAISAEESGGTDPLILAPSEHFERAMQLLADNELHPALPQAGFDVQRDALARTLAGEMQSPDYKVHRAIMRGLLPADDPELREATPTTVNNLSLEDVKAYFATTYRPDLTTIVVVGDVTPAQAKAVVEKYFGSWKASGPKPDVLPRPVPLNPSGYTLVNDPYAAQDRVSFGQVLDLNLQNPDRYALTLGNDVLGGNAFASRLMVDVRVKHGYAYGVGSALQIERTRSFFKVGYGSDPDKVASVDALISKNLAAMQDTPVEADELTNAKQGEIRSIASEVSSVGRIAVSLLHWSYQGLPLDEPMVAAKHYIALTAPQVQAAFKKYLKPQHLVQVVQGPPPLKRAVTRNAEANAARDGLKKTER
ncbi:M16 family metallopeptidase [Rhodanobacter terrae]|uniref:M16 family metallopeptidase n=1 Tax=Rhodanobacter terrae TaxID=418647 RepID=A0ABW0SXB2_9GAMM